jgi:hypothetical protein
MKNPQTLAQMKENDIFSCDPSSVDHAPCPAPQVCHYVDKSIPGGKRTMGSCVPCPLKYPMLDTSDEPIPQSKFDTVIFSFFPYSDLYPNLHFVESNS